MTAWTLTIHAPPPRLPNASRGIHWSHVKRERDRWQRLVFWQIRADMPEPILGTEFSRLVPDEWPLKRARLRIERRSTARTLPDADNCVASVKPILDALQQCGVITSDDPKVVQPGDLEVIPVRVRRLEEQGVAIRIEAVDNAEETQ